MTTWHHNSQNSSRTNQLVYNENLDHQSGREAQSLGHPLAETLEPTKSRPAQEPSMPGTEGSSVQQQKPIVQDQPCWSHQ